MSRPRLIVIETTGIEEYQTQLFGGIHPVLQARGFDRIVHMNTSTTTGLPADLVALLQEARPAGLIFTNPLQEAHRTELIGLVRRLRLATVVIGAVIPGLTSVRGDNFAGMRALMGHLLDERGVRRPALVRGIAHQQDSVDRETVFREEMARRGIPVEEDLIVDGQFWYDHAHRALRDLLLRRRDLDAVVAANDSSARGCIAALNDAGIRVPEDVLVTGFDNERTSDTWPPLTTVDQDLRGQGRAAAEALVAEIDGQVPPAEVVTPSRLVVRESTATKASSTEERLEATSRALETARLRTVRADAGVNLARGLLAGRSLDDLVEAFTSCLSWLALRRCFLVLRADLCGDPRDMPIGFFTDAGEGAAGQGGLSFPVRLLLDYRDGATHVPESEAFPVHQILPGSLQGEISRGSLVMAPLVVGQRQYGFLLLERDDTDASVIETIHLDLARAVDAVLNRRALEAHAALLEETVADRTHQLRAEVSVRRKAETELHRANAELLRMAMLDGLTGIANRAAFDRHVRRQWTALAGTGGQAAVLLVDVDLFKNYNDHFGHVAGDEALRAVARCLAGAVHRPDDLVARYGGEEFVVVLPGGDSHAGSTVALRFQAALAGLALPHPTSPVAPVITASIGLAVAHVRPGTSPEQLVTAADRALYRAKELGRNRTVVVEEQLTEDPVAPALD